MLSSSVENLSARWYNSFIVAGRFRDKSWKKKGGRPKASFEVLQDRVHIVDINLLDCLSKPVREVSNGLVFRFKDGLEGADVPFLSDRAQVLRDERNPQFAECVY